MCKRPSSELPGASDSNDPRLYEDYLLNSSLEVVLSLSFIGLLMDYGPPAWLAYGLAGTGFIIFLIRAVQLINFPKKIMKPPHWNVIPKLLILLSYVFLFFIRDQFIWMWIILALMAVLIGGKLIIRESR